MKVRYIAKLMINISIDENNPDALTDETEIKQEIESMVPDAIESCLNEESLLALGATAAYAKVLTERIAIKKEVAKK